MLFLVYIGLWLLRKFVLAEKISTSGQAASAGSVRFTFGRGECLNFSSVLKRLIRVLCSQCLVSFIPSEIWGFWLQLKSGKDDLLFLHSIAPMKCNFKSIFDEVLWKILGSFIVLFFLEMVRGQLWLRFYLKKWKNLAPKVTRLTCSVGRRLCRSRWSRTSRAPAPRRAAGSRRLAPWGRKGGCRWFPGKCTASSRSCCSTSWCTSPGQAKWSLVRLPLDSFS